MRRRPTQNAFLIIEGYEARRNKGYLDVAGIPTAGVGHTGPGVIAGKVYTDEQVNSWFEADVAEAVETIYRFVPAAIIDELPDESYDALVSFIFNVGAQAFRSPKTGKETNFSKALRNRRFAEVDDRMQDWVYAGGRKINGLITRRADEAARWNRGFELRDMLQGRIATPQPLPPITPAQPAEETNVVPDAPVKEQIPVKTMIGTALTTIGGAAATVGPEALTSAGTQLRALLPDVQVFAIIGGVLIAAGIGLTLWQQYRRAHKSGA